MANSMHSPNGNRSTVLHQDPPVAAPARRGLDKVVAEAREIPKNPEGGGSAHLQFPDKCPLKMQVIDDTALIEPSAGNGKLKAEKKPKRRVRKTRKKKEVLDKLVGDNSSKNKGKEAAVAVAAPAATIYSRKDLEALRFENFENQKRMWIQLYCTLDPVVAEEYDGLAIDSPNNHHHHRNCERDPNFNFDPRPPMQKSANMFAVAAMVKANPLIITAH